MKTTYRAFALAMLVGLVFTTKAQQAVSTSTTLYWMKIHAEDQFTRSVIANTGVSIDIVRDEYIYATGTLEELRAVEKLMPVETSFALTGKMLDFPTADRDYHNYTEMKDELAKLHQEFPNETALFSIGKSLEGRDIVGIRISGDLSKASTFPGALFMGGHHAREHLSVEVPLRFARYLLEENKKANPQVAKLVQSRDIQIVPAVNPDGLEYDISRGGYELWRKNRRRNSDGTYGVDLNRNYAYKWGTGGSSKNPSSDTYMGPTPFSEPETQAVRAWVENTPNATMLLSFHTFSELILYPWGHTNSPVANARDRSVFVKMGKEMAKWNRYTPQQSSQLYIASGDTVDWAYGEHQMFAFTFELDPKGFGPDGFYPGAAIIKEVVAKNIQPCLYMLTYADNPYRVLDTSLAGAY